MEFNKNLKYAIKELRKNKDIKLFQKTVIANYIATFMYSDSTYFTDNFNEYILDCIKKHRVNGDKIENDIITIFNEDWRILSLNIVKKFEPTI
jgi:hypothetical protein|tara:strand:- start:1179 stop:1457 length:279 start_codon:yes stop_codon:yes gene_type:complete